MKSWPEHWMEVTSGAFFGCLGCASLKILKLWTKININAKIDCEANFFKFQPIRVLWAPQVLPDELQSFLPSDRPKSSRWRVERFVPQVRVMMGVLKS